MPFFTRILLATSALAILPWTQTLAADYDPPIYVDDAPEYVPVEIGSGWYLRGDIGYAHDEPFEHVQTPPGFSSDSSLFTGSVGMGYHFNEYLRGELNVGILPTDDFSNGYTSTCAGNETTTVSDNLTGIILAQSSGPGTRVCPGSDNGENKAYTLMANGYVDLGTFSGFTPFIGGGVGVAYSKYRSALSERDCSDSTSTSSGGGTTTTVDFDCYDDSFYDGAVTSEGQYNFAYSVGAGVNYQVTQNLSLDVGYEYFAVPNAEYVTYDSGAFTVHEGTDYHQVKVGLRYDLW